MLVTLTLALMVILAWAPAAVARDQLWKGWSAPPENGRSKVWITDDYQVRMLRLRWTARCTGGRHVFDTTTEFLSPRNGGQRFYGPNSGTEAAFRRSFADEGRYRSRQAGGITALIRLRLRGVLKRDPLNPQADMVAGRLRTRVTVRRRGKIIDRCGVRRGSFEAYRP